VYHALGGRSDVPAIFNDDDRGATLFLKLYAWLTAYVICVHFVILLLPGLCGRMLYSFIPLPRFLGSQEHTYAAALTQRLCNSANQRIFVPLILQGSMVANGDIVDSAGQAEYTILFQRTLGGLEHLLVGYAVLIAVGLLVCYVGNRGKGNGTNSVDQSLSNDQSVNAATDTAHQGARGHDVVRTFLRVVAFITLPLMMWRLASHSILPVLPAHVQHTTYVAVVLVLYLIVVLLTVVGLAMSIESMFQPTALLQLADLLYIGRGGTSYGALACELTAIVCTALAVLAAAVLLPIHYGHYLCPLAGPLQLQFDLPGLAGVAPSCQFLGPLLSQLPLVKGLTALLKLYLTWSLRAVGMAAVLAVSPSTHAVPPAAQQLTAGPENSPQQGTYNCWVMCKLGMVAVGGLFLVALYSSWVHRAPLVVGRWATYCLIAILGPGYSSLAPEWESDLLTYPIGLYLCSLFAQYVCAMLTEVVATVQEALAQRSETARTWSAALHTTLAAGKAPLWVWLRQGGKVLIAWALWLPCTSLLPGTLAMCSCLSADQAVVVYDPSVAATRVGFCFIQAVLS
jgi:hypothetical protein